MDGLWRPRNQQNVGFETKTNQLDPNQPNNKCQGQNWLKTGFMHRRVTGKVGLLFMGR